MPSKILTKQALTGGLWLQKKKKSVNQLYEHIFRSVRDCFNLNCSHDTRWEQAENLLIYSQA